MPWRIAILALVMLARLAGAQTVVRIPGTPSCTSCRIEAESLFTLGGPDAGYGSWLWLTLLSSIFMHGGWLHLGGNMLFLWVFGNNIEDRLGIPKYLAFYLADATGHGVTSAMLSAQTQYIGVEQRTQIFSDFSRPVEPFRIVGNIHYVGAAGVSAATAPR